MQHEAIETCFEPGEGDICTLGLKVTYYHAQTKKTRLKKSPPPPKVQKRNNSNIKELLRGHSWIYMKENEKLGFSDHLVELESVSK